jgi:hypothetical protein
MLAPVSSYGCFKMLVTACPVRSDSLFVGKLFWSMKFLLTTSKLDRHHRL